MINYNSYVITETADRVMVTRLNTAGKREGTKEFPVVGQTAMALRGFPDTIIACDFPNEFAELERLWGGK